jgi:hypothetical protein
MKIHIQISLEHGALFLHDGYGEVDIPPDTGAAPFTFTDTCVCFWVPDYGSGTADVVLSDQPFRNPSPPTFTGRIKAPKKYIALTDVPVNFYFLHHLKTDLAGIHIWNYTEDGEEKFWVQISQLDLFESQ